MKGREDSLSVFMEHALEIIGTLVGLLYLWLEYRASIYLWIAGIIMPAVYIFVYYDAGLYADFGMIPFGTLILIAKRANIHTVGN